jgi:hypothetical protein
MYKEFINDFIKDNEIMHICFINREKNELAAKFPFWNKQITKQNLDYKYLEKMNKYKKDIYLTLHTFNDGKRTEDNVKDTYKIFFDIDKDTLETKEEIESFLGKANYEIKTSIDPIKYQLIYILNKNVDSKELKKIVYTLTTYFKTDHTFDNARIFRVPGFKNWKNDPANEVTYIKNNIIYDPEYILNLLKINGIELLEPEEKINEKKTIKQKVKLETINTRFNKNNKYYNTYLKMIDKAAGDKSRADISLIRYLRYRRFSFEYALKQLFEVREDIYTKKQLEGYIQQLQKNTSDI